MSQASQSSTGTSNAIPLRLPEHRDLYYDGKWHQPAGGYLDTFNPATGESLGPCAEANSSDVSAAVKSAHKAFGEWRKVKPLERASLLKKVAGVLRAHSDELAMIDSANCGNPIREMRSDVIVAANQIEFFAGLVTEVKGETIPMGEGMLNMLLREPYGVVGRITAYNHPIMFTAGKIAPALVTGNTVIMKPPVQAPLSSYRMMELLDGILPPGVLNVLSCGKEGSQALVAHPLVPRLSLIGSVETGRAIARAGADRLKLITLELGGKNACIIYPDADLAKAAKAAVDGMNFTWCGQSCGSVSRLFVHESVYDVVIAGIVERISYYKPGIPTDMATTMGALISKAQLDKVNGFVESAKSQGARLLVGGKRPTDRALSNGNFFEPTVFVDVKQEMRVASEEVFGPVLSVIKWSDEDKLFEDVNAVDYGLTGSVWTSSLSTAHRAVARIEAGYIWVNNVSAHFAGASFGGYKQSGIGREECAEELLSFTQTKNVNITF